MQCYWYETMFYNISSDSNKIIQYNINQIIPSLNLDTFLVESNVKNILGNYLLELKGSYLDSNATIDHLLNEFYDIHYVLPQKGTNISVELSVCDFIPLNVLSINDNDWSIIINEKKIIFKYNPFLKVFK